MDSDHHYAVFAYMTYYPNGGLNDLVGKNLTLEDAKLLASKYAHQSYDYVLIVDILNLEIVQSY